MQRIRPIISILSILTTLCVSIPAYAINDTSTPTNEPTVNATQETTPQPTQTPQTETTPTPQPETTIQANPQTPPTTSDITIHDTLNTDSASITNLHLDDLVSGTKPFDTNNEAGNDANADNLIIRSFDTATYDYTFSITPDSDMDYYKTARVGFQITLPCTSDIATFDTAAMSWADITKGYEATIQEHDGTQTLTAYRVIEPTSTSPTVAPGTYSLPFIINVLAAPNGTIINPSIRTWVAWDSTNPTNTGTHTAATHTPDALTVSAKLNINISTNTSQNTSTVPQRFDFSQDGAQDWYNYNLGKMDGIMYVFAYTVQIRWADRTKGMRGLAIPTGDISFTVDVTTRYKNNDKTGTMHEPEADLQPYLWDNTDLTEGHWHGGRNPRPYGYSTGLTNVYYPMAGYFATKDKGKYNKLSQNHRARTWENGDATITEERLNDRTRLHITVHDYQINPQYFPTQAGISSGNSNSALWDTHYCSNTGELQIGNISAGRILMVSPTNDSNGVNVVDKYNSELSAYWNVEYHAEDLEAHSIDGQTTTSQTVTSDDKLALGVELSRKGNFSQAVLWGCATAWQLYGGVDCGNWNGTDSGRGSDVTMPNSTVSLFASTTQSGFAAVIPMSLVAFDADVIEIPDSPQFNYAHKWDTNDSLSYNAPNSIVYYMVKKDGSNWTNWDEQNNVSLDTSKYDFYKTPVEAKQHGKIIGVLYAQPDAVRNSFAAVGYRANYDLVRATVKATTPVGTTTAITGKSYAWTRTTLAGKLGAPESALDNDEDWSNWAQSQDPLTLFNNVTPDYSYGTDGKYRIATYVDGEYQSTETQGRNLGDSLHIIGERPKVGISTEQLDSNNQKKNLYDIDAEERTVDLRVPFHVETATQPDGYTTDVKILVVLPKKVRYMVGSSVLDGAYTPNGGKHVQTVGGSVCEPDDISINKYGEQVLTYRISGVKPSTVNRILHLAVTLGDAFDESQDVTNNEQFGIYTVITSTLNPSYRNKRMGTYADTTIRVSRTRASQLATRANPLLNDVDSTLGFTSLVANSAQTAKSSVMVVDQLPVSGSYGSSFHGAYTVNGLSLEPTGVDLNGNVRIFISTNLKYQTVDPSTITVEELESSDFIEATVNENGVVDLPASVDASKISVIAGRVSELPAGSKLSLHVSLQPSGNQPTDLYVNRFTDMDNTVSAMASIVDRVVNGIVFVDSDKDGARSDSDKRLSGVKVQLVSKLTPTIPITLLNGESATTITDENGYYEFTHVPAGTNYQLTFTPANTSDWAYYATTLKQAPNVPTNVNSDGTPNIANTLLTNATITLATMPPTSSMTTSRYVDQHEDVGLITIASQQTMPYTGSVPWLYILMGLGISVMICASIILLKKH